MIFFTEISDFLGLALPKLVALAALLAIKAASELSDQLLLKLTGQGREDAFAHFYDRYKNLVFSLTLKMTGSPETAEEITLDTFERVWRNARTYREEKAAPRTWLVSMARNRAIDSLRRRGSRPDLDPTTWLSEDFATIPDRHDQERELVERDLHRQVVEAVRALPPEQQAVLQLAYFGGYTHSEIAARLNMPLGTVKTRLRTALLSLKESFSTQS